MTQIFTNWRTSLFGILSWLIPFLAAFPFFTPEGVLWVPQPLFKSLMVVIGSTIGVGLLVWIFRSIRPSAAAGLVIGVYWLGINWLLDIIVLVPMSGGDIGIWFQDIGLRYLTLPVIAAGIGWVAEEKA